MTTSTGRIAQLLSIPEDFVLELCSAGIVVVDGDVDFEHVVECVRISWTLHDELGVNLAGVEVALHLLSVIRRDRESLPSARR
jgi:hypothetical protein